MTKSARNVLIAVGLVGITATLLAVRDKSPIAGEKKAPQASSAVRPAEESGGMPEKLNPPLPVQSTRGPRLRTSPAPDTGKLLDETSLLTKLHDLAASDPSRSLQLAKEALARFPDSPNAPEFEWNYVKALANMERYPEAKEAARAMVKRYPGNGFAADVERHLLNHPPNPSELPMQK